MVAHGFKDNCQESAEVIVSKPVGKETIVAEVCGTVHLMVVGKLPSTRRKHLRTRLTLESTTPFSSSNYAIKLGIHECINIMASQ